MSRSVRKRLPWNERIFLLIFLVVAGVSALSAQQLRRYAIRISLPRGGSLTGVCLIRHTDEGGAMSVINEFGIKAFDAVYTARKGKVRLLNLIPPLDRRIVRRVLAKDMAVLFRPEGRLPRRRRLTRAPDGSLTLTNRRFKITYHLQPIDQHVTE